MMGLLLKRKPVVPARINIALALILPAAAGAGLLLGSHPMVLLLVGGGTCAAAAGLFLLQRPLSALYVALFFRLFPGEDVSSAIYTAAVYGTIAVALFAWMLHAPYQRQPVQWNGVCLLIALYIVWGGVTLLWAPDIFAGVVKLRTYGVGLILLFLIVNQVRSLPAIDGVMRVLEIYGWTLITAGLLTLFFTDYQHGDRLKVLGINENQFGMFLIMTLPGVFWPVLRSPWPKRGLYLALCAVFLLCTPILVLLSGSRGSVLALAITLFAFSFWKPLRPWAIMGSVLVAGMLASSPFLLDTLANRFMEKGGETLGGRDLLWEASWQLIQDHPLTGMGVGNGRYELHHYFASLTNDYASRDDLPSHNPLLEVGVDTGLFGMFVYASICVAALGQFVRSRGRRFMREAPLAAYFPLVLATTVGYAVSWIKSGGMENHSTFFVLLALLIIPSQLSLGSDLTIGRPVDRLMPNRGIPAARFSQSHGPIMN
jgi:putative inorganic carbon (HCO3(-)) transporter